VYFAPRVVLALSTMTDWLMRHPSDTIGIAVRRRCGCGRLASARKVRTVLVEELAALNFDRVAV
jgi:hypothetical protein